MFAGESVDLNAKLFVLSTALYTGVVEGEDFDSELELSFLIIPILNSKHLISTYSRDDYVN